MIELTSSFLASQILVAIAMVFDFLSFQFKEKRHTLLCLMVSATLFSIHYFLLGALVGGVMVAISVIRFITCYHTTSKKVMLLFMGINTIALWFTYQFAYDFFYYVGTLFIITGNFQNDNKLFRKLMMAGTSLLIIYNIFIFSPVGALVEGSFLISNFIGYWRHYGRKGITSR